MLIPQREDLKWKYTLEKCEIRLHVLGPSPEFPNAGAVYNILSISRNEDDENAQSIDEFLDMNMNDY